MKQNPGTFRRTRSVASRPEQLRAGSPGPLEDLRQDQHGHVATQAVTLPGNLFQNADHGLLRRRIAVVELQRIGPAGKVGIAPVRQEQIALRALDPGIVFGGLGQVEFGPRDVVFGVLVHPGVIEAGMIGDEIEHQLEAPLLEPRSAAAPEPRPRSAPGARCTR